ncbi:hypothetical protein, partial [Aeromonas caviae]|uniref:hypothetical protein n=1 Tax=Aeromonas caviae TaxID=648 RepID=UPI00403A3C62
FHGCIRRYLEIDQGIFGRLCYRLRELLILALVVLQGQYEKFPQAIAQAAKDTLVNFKVTADATVKASAEAA